MCGGGNKHYVVVEVTHTTHGRQTHKTQRARVVLRACSQSCARTTPNTNTKRKKKKKRKRERTESRE
nr:MAG TPA: hypothetical protein [Caudoviricetes sp.]